MRGQAYNLVIMKPKFHVQESGLDTQQWLLISSYNCTNWKAAVMSQVINFLPPTRKLWIEFLATNFRSAQPQTLQVYELADEGALYTFSHMCVCVSKISKNIFQYRPILKVSCL